MAAVDRFVAQAGAERAPGRCPWLCRACGERYPAAGRRDRLCAICGAVADAEARAVRVVSALFEAPVQTVRRAGALGACAGSG